MIHIHPVLQSWLDLSGALATAAETGARRLHRTLRPRRSKACVTRRPGFDTPRWNVIATMLVQALQPSGAKARLARYLGLPRQRLHDFLTGRSRLPDAELTLRLLHWLTEYRAGRDVSL